MTIDMVITQIAVSRIVWSIVLAALLAKLIKAGILAKEQQTFRWRHLFAAGGMPSVHTATVTALTASLLLEEGVTPLSIAVAVFSAIVIRDAVGVRWQIGVQGRAINALIRHLRHAQEKGRLQAREVTDVPGHTPNQVIAGMCLGLLVTIMVYSTVYL